MFNNNLGPPSRDGRIRVETPKEKPVVYGHPEVELSDPIL